MGDRTAKNALFTEFAAVGKALGSPTRLELLDILAQGPRSVDELATTAQVGVSTCSAHLQTLREAGLIDARRDGKRIFYSLAGKDVLGLWDHLRRVAQLHRPHTEVARRAYLGPEDTTAVASDELLHRIESGDAVVLDVRPTPEYAAGHLPVRSTFPSRNSPNASRNCPLIVRSSPTAEAATACSHTTPFVCSTNTDSPPSARLTASSSGNLPDCPLRPLLRASARPPMTAPTGPWLASCATGGDGVLQIPPSSRAGSVEKPQALIVGLCPASLPLRV